LERDGTKYKTFSRNYKHLDRAICEDVQGFIKMHVKEGTDKILGCTIVGGPAGDMICQVTMGMHNKIGLSKIGANVHMYPSYGEAIKGLTDQFNRTKLTPFSKSLLRGIINMKR